jgi:hypothetical protein
MNRKWNRDKPGAHRGAEVDHRAAKAVREIAVELAYGPGGVMHRHYRDRHQAAAVIGAEFVKPIVVDHGGGLQHLGVGAAQLGQHCRCINDLDSNARIVLESDPLFRHESGLDRVAALGIFFDIHQAAHLAAGVEETPALAAGAEQ